MYLSKKHSKNSKRHQRSKKSKTSSKRSKKSMKRKSMKRKLRGGLANCINDTDPIFGQDVTNLRDSAGVVVYDPNINKNWCFAKSTVCQARHAGSFTKNPSTNLPWSYEQEVQIEKQLEYDTEVRIDANYMYQFPAYVDDATGETFEKRVSNDMKLKLGSKFTNADITRTIKSNRALYANSTALANFSNMLSLSEDGSRNAITFKRVKIIQDGPHFYRTADGKCGIELYLRFRLEYIQRGGHSLQSLSNKFVDMLNLEIKYIPLLSKNIDYELIDASLANCKRF